MPGEVEIVLVDGEGMDTDAVTRSLRYAGVLNRIRVVRENEATNGSGLLVLHNSEDFRDIRSSMKQRGFSWLVVAEVE